MNMDYPPYLCIIKPITKTGIEFTGCGVKMNKGVVIVLNFEK